MQTTISIKQLRENLGLSQSQMAILLLISKSRLSMAELNRSLLTPEEMLRFAAIYECSQQNPELTAESHQAIIKGTLGMQDDSYKKYSGQLRIATYKREKLKTKIEKMKIDADLAFNEAHTISKLLNKASDISTEKYYSMYVGQRKAKAHEKMIGNSASAQQAVELEMKILDAEITALSEYLGRNLDNQKGHSLALKVSDTSNAPNLEPGTTIPPFAYDMP